MRRANKQPRLRRGGLDRQRVAALQNDLSQQQAVDMDDQLATMEDNVSNKSNGISESNSRGKKTIKEAHEEDIAFTMFWTFSSTLSKQQQDDLLVLIETFRKSPLNTVSYALPYEPTSCLDTPSHPTPINPPY